MIFQSNDEDLLPILLLAGGKGSGKKGTHCNRLDQIRILLRDTPGPTGVPLAHLPCTFLYSCRDKDGRWQEEAFPCESDADGLVCFGTLEAGREIFLGDDYKLALLYPGHKVSIMPDFEVAQYKAGMLHENEVKRHILAWCDYPYPYGPNSLIGLDQWSGHLPAEAWHSWLESRLNEADLDYLTSGAGRSKSALAPKEYLPLTYKDQGVTADKNVLYETRKVLRVPFCVPMGKPETRISADVFWNLPTCFAAPRTNNRVIPYRDGEDYMREVAYAIRQAKKFIYIADW